MDPQNFDCAGGNGSHTAAVKNADRTLFFGCGSGESRMCGQAEAYEVAKAREADIPLKFVDYRLGESSSGTSDEWLPICPGTDDALAAAMPYARAASSKSSSCPHASLGAAASAHRRSRTARATRAMR